jgi:hypothetical protein
MEKIDRLGWAAGMAFTSYGVRIGIRVNSSGAMDSLHDLLPPHRRRARSPQVERLYSLVIGGEGRHSNVRRFHVLYANTARIARTMDLDEVLKALESDLQLHVAEHARRGLFVHAGVVGWRGSAILIPGKSFTGKSTLVAALVRAGATYYSDEYAILDSRGLVHPYPKRLLIRAGGPVAPGRFWPEALGGSSGIEPLPVGSVVVTRYRPGARWRPRALSPGRGVIALLAHTVSARRQPELTLTTLSRALSQAAVQKGVRGEAHGMVESLLTRHGDRGNRGTPEGRVRQETEP